MHSEDTILLDDPQSGEWDVTVDVESWPQWASAYQSVQRCEQGPFVVGSAALIKQRGLPLTKWEVTSLTPGERFKWETQTCGIYMIATHELITRETGTEGVLRIELCGLIARLLWPLTARLVRRALEQENASLKCRCEEHKR